MERKKKVVSSYVHDHQRAGEDFAEVHRAEFRTTRWKHQSSCMASEIREQDIQEA